MGNGNGHISVMPTLKCRADLKKRLEVSALLLATSGVTWIEISELSRTDVSQVASEVALT